MTLGRKNDFRCLLFATVSRVHRDSGFKKNAGIIRRSNYSGFIFPATDFPGVGNSKNRVVHGHDARGRRRIKNIGGPAKLRQ